MRKLRKLLLTAVGLGVAGLLGCHTAPTPAATPVADRTPGATTSEAAVQRFLAAVRAQDLQAMSAVWGTSEGPARDRMDRAELEKREVVLQCYFAHDGARLVGESPVQEGRHAVRVALTRGGRSRTTTFFTVQGPGGRWYVENMDIAAVRDFCGMAPAMP